MKKLYSLFFALIAVMLLKAQGTINFDDTNKWVQSGSTALGSYASHGYADTNFTATGARVLRNATAAQDGFPGAIGTYSFRLENAANSSLTMTVGTGGIGTFSFKVRRWDDTPATNFAVEYTTDGTNWNNVTTINATITTDSNWKTVNGTINSSNNNVSVRIKSLGSTERIMVDDFSWTASTLSVGDISKSKNIFLKNTMVDNTLSFQTKGNASVKVYNANGQLVKSATISAQNANVNVANLPKGNYVVTAELDGETVSQKILKK